MSTEFTRAGLLGLHALTPLHPGAGTAIGTVDLPVQRERHTHWPNIAGSALKGILRDTCREQISRLSDLDALPRHDDKPARDGRPEERAKREGSLRERANHTLALNVLFGPPQGAGQDAAAAGAVSVTDARLLAYPVRSLKGVFAWVTCPAVMERFARDAKLAGFDPLSVVAGLDKLTPLSGVVPRGCPCLIDGKHLLLEEFKLDVTDRDDVPKWAEEVAKALLPEGEHYRATRERFARQLVVVHDDDFTHFVRYATEVTARIALDYDTKTVKGGALFYQEFLPTESLFYAVVIVNAARARGEQTAAADLMGKLQPMVDAVPVLQIGGDETTGKGYCSVRLTANGGVA